MGWDIPVVIPSSKRPGKVLTLRAVADPILAVPAYQEEDYRAAHPDTEILPVPSEVKGICATRQWIYDRFGDVMMLDDDIQGFVLMQHLKLRKLSPEGIRDMIDATASVARELGAFLFGFAPSADSRNYMPQNPARVSGFIMGICFGMLKGSKMFFHPEATLSEDIFACLVNAYFHRYCWIDCRVGPQAVGGYKTPGGCAEYRTTQKEKENYEFLVRMFGDVIKRKENNNTWGAYKQTQTEFARTASIPF